MSTFRPPSERRSTFNPVFYTSDSETGATLADLDQKLNRINGISSGQTLTNASFSGTVTGLNTGMIPTLDSQLSALSASSVNANFTTNYTKSYLDSWDPATISYLDFSNPAQLGQDVTGKGNDAIVNGPVAYVASATRTHAVKFPLAYVGSFTPSENTPCIQLDDQIQVVKALSPSNWSVSLWVNVDPATSGSRPTIISVARADNTGLPVTYMQLSVQPSGALAWRGRVENAGPVEVGMGTISVGSWAHLAVVFTSTTVTFYINGVQSGVSSLSTLIIDSLATKGINTLTFGAIRLVTNVSTTFTGQLAFAGMMSDISVHARALTQPEIAKLAADDYGASIFVLAGSDNMVGAPLAVAGIDNVHPARAIQYDTSSNQAGGTSVIPASNPLRHLGTVPVGSTGLWRTFVSDLHQYGNLAWRRKILVVPCGYAGSSFASEWAAGGALSNATIAATNGALSRNSMNSVAAILWSAGEIEVANLRLTYAADLQEMLSLFQANIAGFSSTATPIIMAEVSQLALGDYVVGAVGTKRMIQQIREDLATLIASRGNMRVVKTSDLLCMQLSSTNWNIDSIRTLGSRYFDAFSQIKGFSRNQPVTILGPASTISASTGLPVALLTNETLSDLDERAETLEARTATLEARTATLESEVGATLEDLDTKLSRTNGVSSGQTLTNASFSGTVTGLNTGMIPTLDSQLTVLSNANKTVGSEYTKADQDFPAFNSDVLAYYDFSSRTQPGRDFSGNGRHASVLGGSLVTADSTTRTDVLKLTGEYRNTVHSSLISAFPAGMELDAFAPTIQRSTFSTSFWIKWSPFAGDTSLPMMVWSICRPETGATELPGYNPSNMAWCWIRGGSMVFSTFVGGVQTYQQGFGMTPNTWTHVAITTTPGTNQTKFYKNGVLQSTVGTIDVTSIGTATSFTIGCARASDQLPNSANGRQYCNNLQGELSDLMFTSSVLSEQDIARLYADDYGYSIFPLCGQSNMTGQTPALPDDSDYSQITGKVFAYGIDSKTVTPATNPLPSTGSTAGLWLQFCRDFVQNTSFPRKRKVLVIQAAVGGTAMANWVPGTTWYNRAQLAMTEAVVLNSFNKINGFLWNQGEAEMSAFNLGYKAQLLSMIAGYVGTVPTFTVGVPKIMCEISSASYDRFVCPDPVTHMLTFMKSEMLSVVSADPTWAYVRSNDLSFTREGSYSVHYDSPSLKLLGGRYYDSLLKILGIPNTKPVAGRVWQAIKTLQTTTGPAVTKASLGLGNVTNTSDADKPVSTAQQTALDAKLPKNNGVATGFMNFLNAAGQAMVTYGHASIFGAIVANLSNGYAELGFVNNSGATNLGWHAFSWYRYTSPTEKTVIASLTHGGTFHAQAITGPTIDAINTTASLKAPIDSPTFTGTVGGVTKAMVGLGNVTNTTDADKPVSTAQQTALDAKLPKNNGVVTGFMNFLNATGQTISTFGHASIFGAIAANLSNGYGELGFVNNTGFSTLGWHAFSWYRYTSTTEKTVLASLTYGGTFNVPGTITGPTISDLNAADIALQGRALLLEDGASLLGARVGILEAGSGAPTFRKLTQGSTTVETNASLKNVYFLTMNANSNTTLTFPDLVPGDSKYSGFSIKVRVRSGSATKTLTLTCPASTSAFVPMAAGRYNSKVFNALDSYVEYVTAEGDYVELVSTAVNI